MLAPRSLLGCALAALALLTAAAPAAGAPGAPGAPGAMPDTYTLTSASGTWSYSWALSGGIDERGLCCFRRVSESGKLTGLGEGDWHWVRDGVNTRITLEGALSGTYRYDGSPGADAPASCDFAWGFPDSDQTYGEIDVDEDAGTAELGYHDYRDPGSCAQIDDPEAGIGRTLPLTGVTVRYTGDRVTVSIKGTHTEPTVPPEQAHSDPESVATWTWDLTLRGVRDTTPFGLPTGDDARGRCQGTVTAVDGPATLDGVPAVVGAPVLAGARAEVPGGRLGLASSRGAEIDLRGTASATVFPSPGCRSLTLRGGVAAVSLPTRERFAVRALNARVRLAAGSVAATHTRRVGSRPVTEVTVTRGSAKLKGRTGRPLVVRAGASASVVGSAAAALD